MELQMKWQQVNKMRKLPLSEKKILIAASVVLPCCVVGLHLFGFKRCSARLTWLARRCRWRPIAADETRSIRRSVQLMGLALRISPHRGNCLSQSLTLWWLLQCQGIVSELRIGVRTLGDHFQAHAWVEIEGQPLNEMQDVKNQFATFSRSMPVELGA